MGEKYETISLLLCSILSCTSTGILIFYFFYSQQSRTYAFKLVFSIFIFDFILSFDYLCPLLYLLIDQNAKIGDVVCKIQGFVKLLATNGMFFSSLVISWVLYSYFIRKKQIKYKNPIIHYSKFTIALPLIISLIPLITGNYDHTEPLKDVMCFLIVKSYDEGSYDTTGMVLKIALSFIPFVTTIFLELFFVLRILYQFYINNDQVYLVNIKNLILYPSILIISWIWIMFERFYELVTDGDQINWLNSFDLQLGVLNGFFNSIVYGFLSINLCHSLEKSEIKLIESEKTPYSDSISGFSSIYEEGETCDN
ncbi:G protein coupled glucose receptor regulating Gpa2 protein (macronuclear) [Tetrahymena thermophila SB210]|uniref:G protein coupled glucose receptor regulating Gpa2 protein n=1 Tax=Tetrahymena thermophila (strain SB210) TaxID=312017 RepID=Q22E09_TETTS|nr:G protein coupled glucose receptor regulating Gpa2 protein [Tetrahymena thermophila SB210]EAR83503.1 G protein coupled glucose receptor regulating Gpa2 protein [Tetrahymena thermophila SB210]|eukprot:XP_001031166.1 G protein coupled glucose receptor regulating Gpa2 protein [Tetrahymena thermophila SB210]